MVLQRLAFPEKERSEVQDLYIRIFGNVLQKEREIWLKKGAFIRTDTYFNGFFVEEWKRYTMLSKIACTVEVCGKCIVEAFMAEGKDKKVLERKVYSSLERGKVSFCFSLSELRGILAVRVIALEDAFFYGGVWEYKKTWVGKGPLMDNVRIALVICTYQKEQALLQNLNYLKKMILENSKSPLFQKLHVYVIDNGRSIFFQSDMADHGIEIITHQNTGGAGGFTRGMKEAIREKLKYGFSHILLMDDDVTIESASLEKMAAFLACIKKEYRQSFVGGAMLRQDYPWVQHEAGGIWKNGKLQSVGHGLDLRKEKVLLQSSQRKEKPNYAAWWYCCIPLRYVEENGYPMPFFLHFDDVEYSLRKKQTPIYINGIGIWHEQFEQKRSSALVYYNLRNSLFTYQLYGKGKWRMLLFVLYEWYQAVTRYRYKDISLIFKAVEDYKKGLDWLYRVDAEKLHNRIGCMGYRLERHTDTKPKSWTMESEEVLDKKRQIDGRIWRLITLNGNLLPSKKEIRYLPFGATLRQFYRIRRIYLYEPTTKKGVWVEKDLAKLADGIRNMIKMAILLYR